MRAIALLLRDDLGCELALEHMDLTSCRPGVAIPVLLKGHRNGALSPMRKLRSTAWLMDWHLPGSPFDGCCFLLRDLGPFCRLSLVQERTTEFTPGQA
jgi:hypothetical protein